MIQSLTAFAFVLTLLCTWLPTANASERDIRNAIGLGALVFIDNCAKCHQIDGYGETSLYPSLHQQELLGNKTLLIQTILHGRLARSDATDGHIERLMPALGFLTNSEIAAVIAFITNSWGEDVVMVSDTDIEAQRRLVPVP